MQQFGAEKENCRAPERRSHAHEEVAAEPGRRHVGQVREVRGEDDGRASETVQKNEHESRDRRTQGRQLSVAEHNVDYKGTEDMRVDAAKKQSPGHQGRPETQHPAQPGKVPEKKSLRAPLRGKRSRTHNWRKRTDFHSNFLLLQKNRDVALRHRQPWTQRTRREPRGRRDTRRMQTSSRHRRRARRRKRRRRRRGRRRRRRRRGRRRRRRRSGV
ncbi:hypothetical protein TGRH88_037290 [Toxoplasma gondii]|uniref:Uncharacterized protein n=1 Tax=Toxoplasma gondii TaxID=5811 RepID=A0A7J6K810_TOXGO|nr:hypothetical protein TGRH88_037290 [Toxoplasma gondii]